MGLTRCVCTIHQSGLRMCCQGYHIQMASAVINRDKGFLYHPRSLYNSRNFFNFMLSRNMHSNTLYLTTTTSHKSLFLSVDEAKTYIAKLSDKEILNLEAALDEYSNTTQAEDNMPPPSTKQLGYVLLRAAIPFVGFGFLDNAIMILAGEYIDHTIGIALGISTMAAAAIGNLISDLFGLGLADSVEALCRALGIPDPHLSLSQMKRSSVRWMQRLGRGVGVIIGCLIGMAPLLWFDSSHCHDNQNRDETDVVR